MASKTVDSRIHPLMTIGIMKHLPLRKSSRLYGTRDRLSVVMHRRSLSNDGTSTRGVCANMRPNENVRVGISYIL
jgi:hypothetical protein